MTTSSDKHTVTEPDTVHGDDGNDVEHRDADETVTETDETVTETDDADLSPDELLTRLRAATDEAEQMKDAMLRAHAEMENLKRRAQTENVNARKFAIEGFAGELLQVKDSLEQAAAVELDEGGETVAKMKEGLSLTVKQLDDAFARFAVEEVTAAAGEKFDPEMHQAISTVKSAEVAAGHIVTVIQKGFRLHARLLRPALVVVAENPAGDGAGNSDGADDGASNSDSDSNSNSDTVPATDK